VPRPFLAAGTVEAARCEQALEWCALLAAGLAGGGDAASASMADLEVHDPTPKIFKS